MCLLLSGTLLPDDAHFQQDQIFYHLICCFIVTLPQHLSAMTFPNQSRCRQSSSQEKAHRISKCSDWAPVIPVWLVMHLKNSPWLPLLQLYTIPIWSLLASVSSATSLSLCIQWVPEITHHCPKTPFLLVGTQIDLRDDPSTIEKLAKNKQKPITPETAEKLARDLKAVKYVECSALTQVT